MNFTNSKRWIFSGDFLYNHRLAVLLWFGLAAFAMLQTLLFPGSYNMNNYIIYKHVFLHILDGQNLYSEYPLQYNDVNLYGPIFSAIIAPFAALPDQLGSTCWAMGNAAFLYFAIRQLPVQKIWQNAIILLCSNEMMNNAAWYQVNPLAAGCIILGFVYTHKGKEVWALFFILLATFIKIYGIVGLAFFFFSKNKGQYIGWFIAWSLVFFCLPMLYAKPSFVIHSYADWYHALEYKSAFNTRDVTQGNYQDICVMGMVRRIFKWPDFNNWIVLVPAGILFALQYLQIKHFADLRYRLYLLCSVMIFTVIYSTGSEAPTYILAMPAICLWFVLQNPSGWVNAVFIFATILTNFGYSDLLTPYFRKYVVMPYSLKALPCFIIWLILIYQVLTKQFLQVNLERKRKNTP